MVSMMERKSFSGMVDGRSKRTLLGISVDLIKSSGFLARLSHGIDGMVASCGQVSSRRNIYI